MTRPMPPGQWRKSSRCADNGCVEVAATSDGILVRDSTDAEGSVLRFSRVAWTEFIDAIKREDLAR